MPSAMTFQTKTAVRPTMAAFGANSDYDATVRASVVGRSKYRVWSRNVTEPLATSYDSASRIRCRRINRIDFEIIVTCRSTTVDETVVRRFKWTEIEHENRRRPKTDTIMSRLFANFEQFSLAPEETTGK